MCPGGSFGSVFGAVTPPVQAALNRFSQMHFDVLENIVHDGAECGVFKTGGQRPRDVAKQILADIEGALVMGRLTSDPHVIDLVKRAGFRSGRGGKAPVNFTASERAPDSKGLASIAPTVSASQLKPCLPA
jgi:hypothetical protein